MNYYYPCFTGVETKAETGAQPACVSAWSWVRVGWNQSSASESLCSTAKTQDGRDSFPTERPRPSLPQGSELSVTRLLLLQSSADSRH